MATTLFSSFVQFFALFVLFRNTVASTHSSRHPSVSGDNGVRPVGSVFLLRAAPGLAQQSNPSMAVSVTVVAHKVGWLVRVHGLLSLFTFCPFVLQMDFPLLLSSPNTITYSMTPAVSVICELFPAVWVDVRQFQVPLADVLVAESWAAYRAASRG